MNLPAAVEPKIELGPVWAIANDGCVECLEKELRKLGHDILEVDAKQKRIRIK